MQNDDSAITRPLGATPRDTAAPTIPSKSRKRRSSAVRRRANETLHADARLRIYRLGDSNSVRIVLSGARTGTSVEATSHGNIMLVMLTLVRLWLKGADIIAKDTQRELHSADTELAKQSPQLRLESAQRDGRATPGA
jgi:hypothetical protein